MARVAYTDLLLSFDPTVSNVIPDTTQLENIITLLYKRAYSIVYGIGKYSSDESTDNEGIIDSHDLFSIIQAEASRIGNGWDEAGLSKNPTEVYKMPKMDFSKEAMNEIRNLVILKRGFTIDSVGAN
jgi:hypothetical protein